jgi:branched-chain amino acid transport system substrate-binding protein
MKATVYAYYALDALYALEYAAGSALQSNPDADTSSEAFRVAVRDAVENMKDVQVFTSKLTMETDTHNPHNKPVIILQINEGKWQIVKTYAPE